MRIATFVLGLFVFGVTFLQSCAVYALSSIGDNIDGATDPGESTVGAVGGIIIALLSLVGVAFALPLPAVSFVVYLIAASLAFLSGAAYPEFSDVTIYGWALLVLAVMSFFGWMGKRRAKRQVDATPDALT